MSSICFIPIKEKSERVPGKNFKILNDKKLYEYIIENSIKAECFDDIVVDTNSEEIKEFCKNMGVSFINRNEALATNASNGNDLLVYDYQQYPNYDYYFQAFATAPFLQAESIRKCHNILTTSNIYDSCFTAVKHNGFFWYNNMPVSYRPELLPRSQDLVPVIEETTGLYGIKRESLVKYHTRIGCNPYIFYVDKFEAVDINTPEDFKLAEYIGKFYWNFSNEK